MAEGARVSGVVVVMLVVLLGAEGAARPFLDGLELVEEVDPADGGVFAFEPAAC